MVYASVMIVLSPAGRVSANRWMVLRSAPSFALVLMLGRPRVDIRGFGAHARLLGVALLLAAVG
jgi:hypothetical protein